MSTIPNKAMPHAAPTAASEAPETETTETGAASPTLSERAAGLAELVREHPKTAIAAGAAVAAGVAAAIPLARNWGKGAATTSSGGGNKSGGGKAKKG